MQLTAAMLRTLKGSPLSVLMALALTRQPVGSEWLQTATGYSDKSIQTGLNVLVEFGLVTRNGRYAWQIAAGVEQLPLMAPELDEPQPQANQPTEEPAGDDETPEDPGRESENFRVGEFPTPAPLASSSFNQSLESGDNLPPDSRAGESENFRVLDELGIREPARSRLARLAHVTPRLIRYHCATAENFGQAIYRIEHDWGVPDGWKESPLPPFARGERILTTEGTEDTEVFEGAEKTEELEPADERTLLAWGNAQTTLAGEITKAEFETWVLPARVAGVSCPGMNSPDLRPGKGSRDLRPGNTSPDLRPGKDGQDLGPGDPMGVSAETPELIVWVGNPYGARWLDGHVKGRLEGLVGMPVRVEVRNG